MKIVCFSDTHGQHTADRLKIPKGDILIFCGDFTACSTFEIYNFLKWFGEHPHKHKIIVAGNHDCICEEDERFVRQSMKSYNINYLCQDAIEIKGLKFFGTPIQPEFNNWAFNYPETKRAQFYAQIPENTDILITHCPPYGILDKCPGGNVGCKALRDVVLRLKPKYHIFGHVHEASGQEVFEGIKFVNCSVLDGKYNLVNKPIVLKI